VCPSAWSPSGRSASRWWRLPERSCRLPFGLTRKAGWPALAAALALALFLALAGCLPAAAPLPPDPTDTPLPPSATPTPTIVWFPPTATSTPFPTPGVTPTLDLRPQFGELLFTDTFTRTADWRLGRTSQTSIALGESELTLAISGPGLYLYTLRERTDLTDFYLEVTASPSLCKGADEYGLLLRFASASEFYRFSLTCNAMVRLDKYFNGRASSPQAPILSGAVPPGAPSSARLGVWARGKEMRFYINNEYQFTVRDPSITHGTIGLFARSAGDTPVTITFSDLAVYRIRER
jgi:hypothetical protein